MYVNIYIMIVLYLSSTQKQKFVIWYSLSGDSSRRQQTGNGNTGCSLDIIIKRAEPIAVFVKETECIVVTEIFELN